MGSYSLVKVLLPAVIMAAEAGFATGSPTWPRVDHRGFPSKFVLQASVLVLSRAPQEEAAVHEHRDEPFESRCKVLHINFIQSAP